MKSNKINKSAENVDFLFEYEVKNREYDSICLLAAYLQQKGYSVGIVNTWDSLFHAPKAYEAKVMVISACYNDGTFNYFCSHARAFEKAVNLQWEQIRFNDDDDNTETALQYTGIAKRIRHICWGEKEKEFLLRKYNISEKYLKVGGYLPLDYYRTEFRVLIPERQKLFENYGLDVKKRTILFVSSFAYVGLPSSEVNEFEDSIINMRKQISYNSQKVILSWIKRLALECQDIQIVYRPHPAEINNCEIIALSNSLSNFYVISSESIRNWICNCDVLYNWQSTSMVEMFISGEKTHILRPVIIPPEYDYSFMTNNNCDVIATYEEFKNSALDIDEDNAFPICSDKLLEYYDCSEVPAYKKIGQYLIETLKDNEYQNKIISNEDIERGAGASFLLKMKVMIQKSKGAMLICKLGKTIFRNTAVGRKMRVIYESYIEKNTLKQYYHDKMLQNRVSIYDFKKDVSILEKIIN